MQKLIDSIAGTDGPDVEFLESVGLQPPPNPARTISFLAGQLVDVMWAKLALEEESAKRRKLDIVDDVRF